MGKNDLLDYLNILKIRHSELLWYNKGAESADEQTPLHKGLPAGSEKDDGRRSYRQNII